MFLLKYLPGMQSVNDANEKNREIKLSKPACLKQTHAVSILHNGGGWMRLRCRVSYVTGASN